ncbi:MAG: sugar isomerase domain-containing protein [Mycoplasma sp.]
MNYINEVLKRIESIDQKIIDRASDILIDAIKNQKKIWLFGTGHSALLSIEVYTRAGGLNIYHPVYFEELMVTDFDPFRSTELERDDAFLKEIFHKYDFQNGDVLITISNSGRNYLNVEMALQLKEKGLTIIGLGSKEHSEVVTSRHHSAKKIIDIADIFLDNKSPSGDAILTIKNNKYCPISTITGSTILHALTECIVSKINIDPFNSSNLDGNDQANLKKMGKK